MNPTTLRCCRGPPRRSRNSPGFATAPFTPAISVVAIGFPYHGQLTSDFTVTTAIVSSLSGLLNDTRFLQISAAVQPGNSGGPLLGGLIIGMVAATINALKFVRATGNIPENINFAIKTGAIRDFLDAHRRAGARPARGVSAEAAKDRALRRATRA